MHAHAASGRSTSTGSVRCPAGSDSTTNCPTPRRRLQHSSAETAEGSRFATPACCTMADWWSYLSIFDPTDPENFEVGLIILATIWFLASCVDCLVFVLVGPDGLHERGIRYRRPHQRQLLSLTARRRVSAGVCWSSLRLCSIQITTSRTWWEKSLGTLLKIKKQRLRRRRQVIAMRLPQQDKLRAERKRTIDEGMNVLLELGCTRVVIHVMLLSRSFLRCGSPTALKPRATWSGS